MRTGAAALLAALTVLATGAAAARADLFPMNESFTGSSFSTPGWHASGDATLTAPAFDLPGNGWMRLTAAQNNQFGYVINDTAFPSDNGLLVDFDYATYGGTNPGADGLSFFLYDGSTPYDSSFHVGTTGGSLGYAACPSRGNSGVTNAYIGIGFDEWGNYTHLNSDCSLGDPGEKNDGYVNGANFISVRGGTADHFYLLRDTSGKPVSVRASGGLTGTRTNARHVTVSVTRDRKLSVYVAYPDGSYQTVVKDYQLPTAPGTLKFGFAGSTGGSNNFHEIRNNKVVKPADLTTTVTDGHAGDARDGTHTWTVTVANSDDNDTLGNTVRATSPNSSLKDVTWTCVSTSGTCGAAAGTGMPDTTSDLPKGASATYTITAHAADGADYAALKVDAQPTGATGELNPTDNAATDTTDLTPVADTNPSTSVVNSLGRNGTATATAGSYRGGHLTITRNWQSCDTDGTNCADIPGATGTTYAMSTGMRDHALRLREHVANAAGAIDAYSPVYATFPETTVTGGPSATTSSDSASFTIGSDKSGAAFDCDLDGGGWVACTSPKGYADLADGSHTVRFRAVYAALADQTPASRTWTVDTIEPDQPAITGPADGTRTHDATPTVSFDAEPGARVDLYADGTLVGTATADVDGHGTVTPSSPLADGSYDLVVRATDAAGNESAASASVSVVVDTVAPAAPDVTAPAAGLVTRVTAPAITLTGEPGADLEVEVDGAIHHVTLDGGGDGTLVLVGPLADGGHTVRSRATDAAGNTGPWSATTSWTVKTSTHATLTGPPTGPTASASQTVSYTGEPGATYAILVDGRLVATGTIDGSGKGSVALPATLADGRHTLTVAVTDVAGNVDSHSTTVDVDTAAPAPVRFTRAPGEQSSQSSPTFAFAGESGGTLECALDRGAWGPCPSTLQLRDLADGPHVLRVRVRDAAGNASVPQPYAWTVDTAVPAAPVLLGGPDRKTIDRGARFELAPEPGATLECSVDGRAFGPCPDTLRLKDLGPGRHSLTVRQIDAAGNASPETRYAWTVRKTVRETRSHRVRPGLAPKVTVADERTLAVGCNLDAGALRTCRVGLYHGGHRIGQRMVKSHGTHGRTVVHVRLNARGRRLLRRAIGGLSVRVRVTARNTKAQTLHATSAGTIYPPRVFSLPILFATDRASLTQVTTRIARRIAHQVRHARSVVCEGYTDSRGTAAHNHALGLRRARTVCGELRAMGVHTRMRVVSHGETRPRTSNATARGRALNRQVVVRVSY